MEIVLQDIRTHWFDNPFLTDANVTCKLTTLLVLNRASRIPMIKHLNTEFMARDKGKYKFHFNKLHMIYV